MPATHQACVGHPGTGAHPGSRQSRIQQASRRAWRACGNRIPALCHGASSIATWQDTHHTLTFGQQHVRAVLTEYIRHYNGRRPRRARGLRPPRPDHPVAEVNQKRIKRRPVLGGLINEYEPAA